MFQFTLTPSRVSEAKDYLLLKYTEAANDKPRNNDPIMFLSSFPTSLIDKHRTFQVEMSTQRRETRKESALIILPSQSSFLP